MAERQPSQAPPSGADGEGVRTLAKPRRRQPRSWAVAVAVGVLAVAAWWILAGSAAPGPRSTPASPEEVEQAAAGPMPGRVPPSYTPPAEESPDMPSKDPDDLAAYFRPGDPEPTGAEVITALQQAGVRTGLGAFNPPGTSPPLDGLAVPPGFKLPPGYVRHHQVTDEGVPIEPILMFSPDFTLHDAQGRPIPMPANRVVPPGLAPPGMPVRLVRIGKP